MLGLVEGLREHGIATLLVTHNMQHVLRVANRVAVLRLGQKVADVDLATHSLTGMQLVGLITGELSQAELEMTLEEVIDLGARPQIIRALHSAGRLRRPCVHSRVGGRLRAEKGVTMTADRREVQIPVEGALLAAACNMLPDGEGPFPVAISMYPYRKDDIIGSLFLARGCALPRRGSPPCLSTCAGTGHLRGRLESATTSGASKDKTLPRSSSG